MVEKHNDQWDFPCHCFAYVCTRYIQFHLENAGRNMMGFGQNGGVSASSAQTQHIYIWFFMELFYLQKSSICIPHCCSLCWSCQKNTWSFKKTQQNTEMQDKYAKETEEIDIERWVFFLGRWHLIVSKCQYMDRYIYCAPLSSFIETTDSTVVFSEKNSSRRVAQTNLEFAHLWFPQDGWFALVIVEMVNAAMLQAILETYVKIPLRKLRWQWKIHHLKMSC